MDYNCLCECLFVRKLFSCEKKKEHFLLTVSFIGNGRTLESANNSKIEDK